MLIKNFEDAIEFYSRFGNVSKDVKLMQNIEPTEGQLDAAGRYAMREHNQLETHVVVAKALVLEHWNKISEDK